MNKKNLILIAGLLIFVLIYFMAKKREHIESDFKFIGVDSLAVNTITLTTTQDTLVIVN
jgi:hypothetical protein